MWWRQLVRGIQQEVDPRVERLAGRNIRLAGSFLLLLGLILFLQRRPQWLFPKLGRQESGA